MDNGEKDFDAKLEERFNELPKIVQDAITSADVERHLRELAEHHKLHLDQWEKLENEVMLALLGFQPADQLAANIEHEVNVSEEVAVQLAADISHIVFEPIRQELERQLEHPDAVAKQVSGVDAVRTEILAHEAGKSTQPAPTATPAVAVSSAPTPIAAPATAGSSSPGAPAASAPATPAPAATAAGTPVVPATPPAPAPETKVERAAVPESYATSASHERKTIAGDPYREQLE